MVKILKIVYIRTMILGYSNTALDARFSMLGEEFDFESFSDDLYDLYSIPIKYIISAMEPATSNTTRGKYHYLPGYIAATHINAVTCDEGNGSIICLNSCAPILLFKLCVHYTFCCNLQTALAAGNPIPAICSYKEPIQVKLEPSEILPQKVQRNFNYFKKSELYKRVVGSGKLKYALYLYDLATRFLVMHECMHVVLGHTAYMRKEFGVTELLAFSEIMNTNAQMIKTLQALEFMADLHTASGVFLQALHGNLFLDYTSDTDLNIDKECFVARSVINALCILFRLFPFKWKTLADVIKTVHPHPYIRLQWILTGLSNQLTDSRNFEEYLMRPMGQSLAVFADNFAIEDND
ncbi:MAG: hypothetical protein K2I87_07895 [Bacteroidales bacterium]|nr:hypothetical protein [Bacteroidales bacterium]